VELEPTRNDGFEIDLLHRIGGHVARGDTLDEALAGTVDFAVALVNCDECFTYVREGEELVPWVWKHVEGKPVEPPRLGVDCGYAAALGKYRAPIALSQGDDKETRVKAVSEWSTDPGETFVCVPLLARSKLVGMVSLHHRVPHRYKLRDVKLILSAGYLLGADIRLSQLDCENSGLVLQLETRKLVERSKGILQRDLGLNEEEAYLVLRRQSRQTRRPMKEIAQAIVLSDEVRQNSGQPE
jgi:GAF domain-containing protein